MIWAECLEIVYGADADDRAYQIGTGDLNGDGVADLVIGAETADGPGNTRTDAGEAYVFYGGGVAYLDVGDGRAAPGRTGTAPVTLSNASGMAGMQFDLTYNIGRPGLLAVADVRRGAALPNDWVVQYGTGAGRTARCRLQPDRNPAASGSSGVVA